jgi:hypothetical protein
LFVCLQQCSSAARTLSLQHVFAVLVRLKVLDSSASSLFPLSFPTSFRFSPTPSGNQALLSAMRNVCPYIFYMLFSILSKTDCITPISSVITL